MFSIVHFPEDNRNYCSWNKIASAKYETFVFDFSLPKKLAECQLSADFTWSLIFQWYSELLTDCVACSVNLGLGQVFTTWSGYVLTDI